MSEMDSQKRLLLAFALSFVVITVYTTFVAPPPQEAPGSSSAIDGGTASASVADGGVVAPSLAQAEPAPVAAVADAGVALELPPVVRFAAQAEAVHFKFNSEGGGLEGAELQGEKMRAQVSRGLVEGFKRFFGSKEPPPQMKLAIPVPGRPLPLAVSVEGAQPFPASTRYKVTSTDSGARRVEMVGASGTWEISKVVEWEAKGTELRYTVAVKNVGAAAAQGELGVHLSRLVDPTQEHPGSMFGDIGNQSRAVCYDGSELRVLLPGGGSGSSGCAGSSAPAPDLKGPIHFFGIDQQYFLEAVYPLDEHRPARCALASTERTREADAFFPLSLEPGQSATFRFGAFLGPKDMEMLSGITGDKGLSPHLEKTVDFGWWAAICKVLLTILKLFHGLTGNWGVAIILLTVLVKVVLMPLTHKQMVSAESMKKLQPKMEEIRKKFPDDRERQNAEMMKLYQEEKVNPLGGCFPILIQLPIWAALFTTLRTSYEIYREPFIGPLWVDLTAKDPVYLLPLALGITMIITQKLQPQMMDAAQARMMTYFMPIFFTALMLNYPAGLTLYIFTNNILSIAQQYGLQKYLKKKGLAAPVVAHKGKAAK